MNKSNSLTALLLLSTALVSPAAFAQSDQPDASEENPEQDQESEEEQEDIDISAPGADVDEIVVRGRFIPDPVRATPQVVSVLGAEEIARTAEGDIAGSLKRVTGLSVVSGRFVFVRGLGDRYSLALLNGLPLPSPEPLRRVVPLDLFPTSVIGSTVVQKSYSASFPGEFGGGVINLTTKSAPEDSFIKLSAGISGDTVTTGQLGFTSEGSSLDFLGFDNGTRAIPDGLQAAIDQNIPIVPGNFSNEELQGFAASLESSATALLQTNNDIPANFSLGLDGGTSFDVGSTRIGVIATAGWKNSFRTRFGVQQTTTDPATDLNFAPTSSFDFVTTENRIVVNGLLGLSAEFNEHKVRFTNLYVRDTIKDGRIRLGFNSSSPDDLVNDTRTGFFARQLFSTQAVGEFKFNDFSVDVRGSYANSRRDAPFERSFSFVFDEVIGDFVNNLNDAGESANISFSDLTDDVFSGGIDLGYRFNSAIPITLSGGYNYYLNERSASRRDFTFDVDGLPNPIDQLRPDFLLSDFTIFSQGIELVETATAISVPNYDAELEIHAVYGEIDIQPVDGVRVNLGLRYEDASQTVTPLPLTGTSVTGFEFTNLNNDNFLPAATITWNFAEDAQFRLAASRTIGRPQFRELAEQQFLDLESDRTFIGNPSLVDSDLFNLEARFEYYFGREERVTGATFYKRIDNPVETIAFFQGDSAFFQGFSNAPSADLYGFEVEAVKFVPLYGLGDDGFFGTRRLLIAANYTFTQSSINTGEGNLVSNPLVPGTLLDADALFNDGSPLVGQSDHIVNLQLGLENEERLSQQTLLLSFNSDRVSARGFAGQPDLITDTGVRIDFVWREGFDVLGKGFELKFEVRNILGEDFIESQSANGNQVFNNSFEVGTSFSLGISAQF